jgi:MFS family permease
LSTSAYFAPASRKGWAILAFGSLVIFIALGVRHIFGLFQDPITKELPEVSREAFGFALALQNLLWGIGQPFAGVIADRFGSARVIFVGGLLYAGGLLLAATSTGPLALNFSLGLMIGLGLSCTSYAVVLGAVGRHFPPAQRSSAMAIATIGGSVGIFCSVPVALGLISNLGWVGAFVGLAAIAAVMCVAAPQLAGRSPATGPEQSLRDALSQALGHRGFLLLMLGFFACGFQLAFIGIHLPAYLADRHLDLWVAGTALAAIGITNIIGTFGCGILGDRYSKKKVLALIYLIRAAVVAWFVVTPVSPTTTIVFGVIIGFTWLGVVPLTSGIVAQVFGPRYLSTLVGIVFLMHQVGSFLGAWLGGLVFDLTESYDTVWWSVVLLGLLAAILHWPIDERPMHRGIQPATVAGS